jgi:phosphatidate cytidylyltransferase
MEPPKISIPKFNLANISGDLRTRLISAGILAPLVLAIIYIGGPLYNTMIVAIAVIMSFEWQAITHSGGKELDKQARRKWAGWGIAYVTIFASSLIYLRSLEGGFGIVFLMLCIVWATDIAAFFTGRIVGGQKIYPKISPNKTWSGLLGGMIAAGLVGALASFFLPISLINMFFLSMSLAIIAQVGDFFESWVKRQFGVKDSGTLIPGHGGLMDRLDGFTTVAPVFVIFTWLYGSGPV